MHKHMDIWQKSYASNSALYEKLIVHEDYRDQVFTTLKEITPFEGQVVVEFGAGTGRLTRRLVTQAAYTHAFDLAPHMLLLASEILNATGKSNWSLGVADNRAMPIQSKTADVAIQGWSFGHSVGWYPDSWQAKIQAAIREMARLTKEDGLLIMLETMGTGAQTATPPPPLIPYYAYLEELGFQSTVVRTDYHFPSVELASAAMTPYFGDGIISSAIQSDLPGVVVPECTGIWWRRSSARLALDLG
ncbi:MAG: class I SAM-dependent methyltransferase [Chloroflexota bacterium]